MSSEGVLGEMTDPGIKLFGKTIAVTDGGPCSGSDPDPTLEAAAGEEKDTCNKTENEIIDAEMDAPRESAEREKDDASCLNHTGEHEIHTSSQDVTEKSDSKLDQDQSEAENSEQEKVLKKPDKILPCPRCNSLDTKFCYYNNYNVNQPRHFCKNCQRYWTAGGTMRNVPVGAGRRKSKHSTSHYRHIMMSPEGLASTREAIGSTLHHGLSCGPAMRSLNGNQTVLKFGPETPLCESMSSVLNLGQQKITEKNTGEPSCVSSVTGSNCAEKGALEIVSRKDQTDKHGFCNGVTPLHPLPYYPWPYPWSSGWNVAAAMASGRCSSELSDGSEKCNVSSMPWTPPSILAAAPYCCPSIPVPFIPASFWPTAAWNVPWAGSNGSLSPSSSTSNSCCSGSSSLTLGKHSREANLQTEEKTEKSLWIPKTLRIDDPDDAAKSSIWATLGIKPEECGMFKAFQSKSETMVQKSDASQVVHANPAAFSRSQSFQEST